MNNYTLFYNDGKYNKRVKGSLLNCEWNALKYVKLLLKEKLSFSYTEDFNTGDILIKFKEKNHDIN